MVKKLLLFFICMAINAILGQTVLPEMVCSLCSDQNIVSLKRKGDQEAVKDACSKLEIIFSGQASDEEQDKKLLYLLALAGSYQCTQEQFDKLLEQSNINKEDYAEIL